MAKRIDVNDVDYSQFLPTQDYVLVKRDSGEEKTEAGIWYAKEQNKQTGLVVAVGDDEVFETSRVKAGSKIYFIEKDYMPVGEFIIIKLSSIIGVFE
jgi:co-chaperonin GroES (HSP10)